MAKTNPTKKNVSATPTAPTPQPTVPTPRATLLLPDFWKHHALPLLFLVVLSIALYAYTVTFEYVLDDKIVISQNEFTKKGLAGIIDIFANESFTGHFGEQKNLVEGARYRPLSMATFAIEHQFFGLTPFVGHLNNILLYALTAIVLFRLLVAFYPPTARRWWEQVPFWATVLFVTHPLHTEVVANIKGRDEILSLLFGLLTLYGVLKYHDSQRKTWLAFYSMTFAAALFSKENALTFLAVVPLVFYFYTQERLGAMVRYMLPLVAVTAFYMGVRYAVIGYLKGGENLTDLMNNPFLGMQPADRMATIFYTLLLYVKLHFFPHPLTHDYYPYHIPKMTWGDWQPWLAFLTYAALVAIMLYHWRKQNGIGFGIAFYLITLSIVSNIPFSIGTFMNERFVYMSSVGFCLAFAYWIVTKWLHTQPARHWAGIALLSLMAIGFSLKTLQRVPDWKDQFSLNLSAYKVSSQSARANLYMGTAIFEKIKDQPLPTAEKMAHLQKIKLMIDKSLSIVPDYGSALHFKAGILGELYKLDNDYEKLLTGFDAIMRERAEIPFIDQFLQYLHGKVPTERLIQFYHQIAFEYYAKEVRNPKLAYKYLHMAQQLSPNDPLIANDIAQLQNYAR